MIFLLFCMLWGLEIALDIWSIIKQREKHFFKKNRVITRGVQLVVFTVIMLLPGISFSFRTKLLFGVLVIQLLIAAIAYFPKKNKLAGQMHIGTLVARIVSTAVLYVIALVPAILFAEYNGLPTTGDYEVAMTDMILVDESRQESFETDGSKREVPVHMYYPKTEGGESEFPLVLFSHGAFGYYESNTSTYMELASHGYVVLSLDHPYHSFYTNDTSGKLITVNPGFINDVMYVNEATTPEEEIFALSSTWLALRTADINFVLDSMKEVKAKNVLPENWVTKKENEDNILSALFMADCDNIGVMGHSLGGAAAVSVGRERDDVHAVIDLDGTMLGEQVDYQNGKYIFSKEPYPVPLLAIDNEEHHVLGLSYQELYVNNVIIRDALDGKYTYFKNAGHMNFTDLPLFSPFLAAKLGVGSIDAKSCIEQTNGIVLMYFDHYLKNKGEVMLKEYYQ